MQTILIFIVYTVRTLVKLLGINSWCDWVGFWWL